MASGPQIGTRGGYFNPDAAQCTTTASGAMVTLPPSSVMLPRSTRRMCPSRTTFSTRRSSSSSHCARVCVLAIVGGSVLLHAAAAEERGRDAVERGRLVQPDERVGAEPVPADVVTAVDEGDADVGMGDEGVGERHPHRSGPYHHVVGLHHPRHGLT